MSNIAQTCIEFLVNFIAKREHLECFPPSTGADFEVHIPWPGTVEALENGCLAAAG